MTVTLASVPNPTHWLFDNKKYDIEIYKYQKALYSVKGVKHPYLKMRKWKFGKQTLSYISCMQSQMSVCFLILWLLKFHLNVLNKTSIQQDCKSIKNIFAALPFWLTDEQINLCDDNWNVIVWLANADSLIL